MTHRDSKQSSSHSDALISVVIPVYNRKDVVMRALESVKAQSLRPLHLILVDNNSTDGSYEELLRWADDNRASDFTIEVLEERQSGACAARNAGLQRVQTPFVSFFDSDDVMYPQLLEKAVSALLHSSTPDNAVAVWKALYHRDGESRVLQAASEHPLRNHLFHAIMSTQRFALSTQLALHSGGWNTSLPCWNDWEFSTRCLLQAPTFTFIDEVLVDIYWMATSITGRTYADRVGEWERSLDAVERALMSSGTPEARRQFPLIPFRRAILAGLYLSDVDRIGDSAPRKASRAAKAATQLMADNARSAVLTTAQRRLTHVVTWWTRHVGRGMTVLFGKFF